MGAFDAKLDLLGIRDRGIQRCRRECRANAEKIMGHSGERPMLDRRDYSNGLQHADRRRNSSHGSLRGNTTRFRHPAFHRVSLVFYV